MSEGYIKYFDLTIGSAFKEMYVVPDYQREYVWTNENVEQLLEDLNDAYESDCKKTYFLGTVVTYNDEVNSCFELIDGQQRITTFFVLLCAVKNRYLKAKEKTSILDGLIYSSFYDENGDEISQYHLRLQYEDAGKCLELLEQNKPRPDDLSNSGNRLFDAYNVIDLYLENKFPNIADLKKFVVFILNKTSFVRIETGDITDALKIFETINQRGKGLDPMDLLKNMIFRNVDRSKFEKLNIRWKEITDILEKIDEKPLRFLRYFIMANYDVSKEKDGIIREDRIYKWLIANNNQCQYKEKPFEFVRKMKDNVDLYSESRNPSSNDNGNIHLKNIPMLAGKSYKLHIMLILAAYNMNSEAISKLKKVIESVVYYTVINKITTNVTERVFASWCKSIRKITTVNELDAFIKSDIEPVVKAWKSDNESNFLRLGINSMQQYRIKFILAKITAYIDMLRIGETEVADLDLYTRSTVEIEHIMPQTCSDKSMYGMTDEEYEVYISRLGNLTLLENSINKSIQNDVYDVKKEAYKKSKFYLTSSISLLVTQGNNTAINRTNTLLKSWDKWDADSISGRQKMMYELSEKIWTL